jgi:hypothetical protein
MTDAPEQHAPERHHEHHLMHRPEPRPASNYHVFLSFGLSALVTVLGFAATWGRSEQWRETVNERLEKQDQRDDQMAITVAQHEATIRVVESQYQHIGKQLDRVESSLDRLAGREQTGN